jgi:hypothetical protein
MVAIEYTNHFPNRVGYTKLSADLEVRVLREETKN